MLWDLPKNTSGIIDHLRDVQKAEDRERLQELGFDPGEEIFCLQRTMLGGPRVYRIGDSVFSLAAEIARTIAIKPLPKP